MVTLPTAVMHRKECEIEVRQLWELEDVGPSESVERFRDLERGKRK